jgi:isoprenylcysteine carboxyl methyltransferase (ICMT) family protein YpbQ
VKGRSCSTTCSSSPSPPNAWSSSRSLRHPNYTAVAAEVAALPLVHSASLTATVFSIANALVLTVRIRAENTALGYA